MITDENLSILGIKFWEHITFVDETTLFLKASGLQNSCLSRHENQIMSSRHWLYIVNYSFKVWKWWSDTSCNYEVPNFADSWETTKHN